ncbi:MAG: hypothetical protein WBW48_10045 [Anaerolineae bacterium]
MFKTKWYAKTVYLLVALVLSLGGLVMAVPVSANVTAATVTVAPTLASTAAQYTIAFNTTVDLAVGTDTIRVEFPIDTTVGAIDKTKVTVNGTAVSGTLTVGGRLVTLTVPVDVPAGAVTVIFAVDAGLVNPSTAAAYTLKVSTSKEVTQVTSTAYNITPPALPTVTSVAPPQANAGETMSLVTIGGTNFTGATAVSFGTGVIVTNIAVATDGLSLTVTVAIASGATAGTRSVTVTTPVGTNVANTLFTVAAAGIKKVDRFSNATPPVYVTNYDTITAAVAEATTGETLKVHAATYSAENPIVFAVANVTLKSYMGADSTTIGPPPAVADPNATDGMTIKVIADNITIGGSGAGFTIITRVSAGIWAPFTGGSATGLQILYNKFQAVTQGESRGIWIEAPFQSSSAKQAKIQYNDFSQATAYTSGGPQGAPGTGIQIVQAALGSRALISNNTAANQRYTWLTFKNERKRVAGDGAGDESVTAGATTVAGVDVYLNVVHDNGRALQFSQKGSTAAALTIGDDEVRVYKNQFYSNGDGVWIDDTADNVDIVTAKNIHIHYNDIYSNTKTTNWTAPTKYGINSEEGNASGIPADIANATVDAKYNWWGAIGGPSGVGLGLGDKVSTYVTFDPWLTRVQATAVSDGIAYHGDTYPLEAGWNTLSVPLALDDSADTMNDIVALGSFFVTSGPTQNYLAGYYYDAASGLWQVLSGTYEFAPCNAVYVKMGAAANFPILYSGVFSLPSVSLPAGWNLVGSAFGIDKTPGDDYGIAATGDPDGLKAVNVALNSIAASGSVVLSPSMPGQTAVWGTTIAAGGELMIVGEGYWVFMTAPGTLAGFEVTPIYKIFPLW